MRSSRPRAVLPLSLLLAIAVPSAQDAPSSISEAVDSKAARLFGEPCKSHDNMVAHVAFASTGDRALSAGWDGVIKVWNTTSGAEHRRLEGHEGTLY